MKSTAGLWQLPKVSCLHWTMTENSWETMSTGLPRWSSYRTETIFRDEEIWKVLAVIKSSQPLLQVHSLHSISWFCLGLLCNVIRISTLPSHRVHLELIGTLCTCSIMKDVLTFCLSVLQFFFQLQTLTSSRSHPWIVFFFISFVCLRCDFA